ncbi:hypothetical protein FMM05_07095 [Flavobacterium zepuense]|uniref:Uncharacterized protein n=1 Tax=Flavobacterium zepuense TaxID=2593302 RepID=A0A552V699_9FLAO|nr:hypothetical protein [Flavobacterium zepuense]TRW25981.1 hypothetical protein FMM05_07095 [Flavobacterium zepuense]
MNKPYKVTYKTYLNDRLKQVLLHGQETYPLYVQLTYERKTIFFKSYYFELFSKPRYFLSVAGISKGPSLEEITVKEKAVIDFIIDKYKDDFSIELFKEKYAYYSKDLCDETEGGFIDYLHTFFQDKGMPAFAVAISQGTKYRIAYEVIRDMKIALTKPLYEELVENSLFYAPPYLPLYGFMKETKRWPILCLTVMEWESADTQDAFIAYLKKHYPNNDADEITKQVEKWLGAASTNI